MTTANTAQINVGQKVFSAIQGDHGCREGWVAEVTANDGITVTATITKNTVCATCWQVGCIDNGRSDNDMVGQVIIFDINWASENAWGDVEVGNWAVR